MNGLSNLPPGCSSPDGGIDHAMEAAIEELGDAVELPDPVLDLLVAELELPHYVAAFAKIMKASPTKADMARAFSEALVAEYKSGHADGKEEGWAESSHGI